MTKFVVRVNRGGIPCIRNTSAAYSADRLTITFQPYANVSDEFQGLFLVKLDNIPDPPTGADPLPVYLFTEGYLGSEKQLFTPQTEPVPSTDVKDGVYLCFYDSATNRLRVMM